MKLIVGIGNPGRRYDATRHNVGFDVVKRLSAATGASGEKERFHARVADGVLDGEKVVLAAPQTYVNDTGRAVRAAIDWYELPLDELMIVCDDLNLPLGALRLRPGGSSGGHRGLESVARWLGTEEFPRLRIGIGGVPHPAMDAADYVLSRFLPEEREQVEDACDRAARAVELWVREGLDAAMNRYNRTSPQGNTPGGPDR